MKIPDASTIIIGAIITLLGLAIYIFFDLWQNTVERLDTCTTLSDTYKTKRDEYKTEWDKCERSLTEVNRKIFNAKTAYKEKEEELKIVSDSVDTLTERIAEIKKEKQDAIDELDAKNISFDTEVEELRYKLRKSKELNAKYEAEIEDLEDEKIKLINEIEDINKKMGELMAAKRVAEKEAKTFSYIDITEMTKNSLKFDLNIEDAKKLKERDYGQLHLLTGIERLTDNKRIEPVGKNEGGLKVDSSFTKIQPEYAMTFEIGKEILKNYKGTVYKDKQPNSDEFKITVYLKNNDKEKIAVRLFYLKKK